MFSNFISRVFILLFEFEHYSSLLLKQRRKVFAQRFVFNVFQWTANIFEHLPIVVYLPRPVIAARQLPMIKQFDLNKEELYESDKKLFGCQYLIH